MPAAPAKWTDPVLTINGSSLGAVKIGMTFDEAQQASGVTFDGRGDGAAYSNEMPAGDAHPFINAQGQGPVNCIGAGGGAGLKQSVVTPEGFRLGDSLAKLKSVYGARLVYLPGPTAHDIYSHDGYVVAVPGGRLGFLADKGIVDEIVSGPSGFDGKPLTPSTCID
jgi:hypothetical protein